MNDGNGDAFRRLNETARRTGQTHAEILTSARDALLGKPTGFQKWKEVVTSALRQPTEQDRANRQVYEENLRRENPHIAAARESMRCRKRPSKPDARAIEREALARAEMEHLERLEAEKPSKGEGSGRG